MTKLYLHPKLIPVVNNNPYSLRIMDLMPKTLSFVLTCPNLVPTYLYRLGRLKPAKREGFSLSVPSVLTFLGAYMRSVRELFLLCFISRKNYFLFRLGQITIKGIKISLLYNFLG